MKKLLQQFETLIIGDSLARIQKRMAVLDNMNENDRNFIAKRTVKIGRVRSTEIPFEWVQDATDDQAGKWHEMVSKIRVR